MLKPRHTFESVAHALADGLSDGTLILQPHSTEEFSPNDRDLLRAPYQSWKITAVAALGCCLATFCGAAVTVRFLVQKNVTLKNQLDRVAANLHDVSVATAQLKARELQIESQLKMSEQQADAYHKELLDARKDRLSSQSSSYVSSGPSVATLTTLATVHLEAGDFARAQAELERALALAQENGNRRDEAAILEGLGELYQRERRFDLSENFLRSAVTIRQVLNDPRALAQSLTALATVLKQTGREVQAQALYDQATAMLTKPPEGRIMVSNRTGALITVSWSGSSNGTLSISDIAALPIGPGAYRLSITTRCGSRTEDVRIANDQTQELTFACMK